MRSLFIDTWGWIAFLNRDDPHHEPARAVLEHAWAESLIPVFTSWPVILETVGFRGRRAWRPESAAREITERLKSLAADRAVLREVVTLTETEMHDALELKLAHGDPRLSLVDCTVAVCCRRLGVKDVLSGDDDLQVLMPEAVLHGK